MSTSAVGQRPVSRVSTYPFHRFFIGKWPKDTPRVAIPRWFYPHWMKGYYPEDYSCDIDMSLYFHPRELRTWYARTEIRQAKYFLQDAQTEMNENHRAGLAHSGQGPFERELERKGIQVEKYPLPSTVGVKRVHEMVILRRKELEKKAEGALEEAKRHAIAQHPAPSQWYDEEDGPLNLHFLHYAQKSFPKVQITELPRTAIGAEFRKELEEKAGVTQDAAKQL